MSDITDINDEIFFSDAARNEFIVKYYEDLYSPPDNQRNDLTGCIEEFLGQDILSSPLVSSMKITREMSASLDREISIFELDSAVNETKTRTAAGPDGISNNFIKKFWPLLRVPLSKYANYCFETGNLSQSFLTASIKLIPKKGDCS